MSSFEANVADGILEKVRSAASQRLTFRSGFKMERLCCKSPMHRGSAPFSIDRNSYRVSWEAIPAWVCDQCGESLFETTEVNTIQDALTALDRETVALAQQASSPTDWRQLFSGVDHPDSASGLVSKRLKNRSKIALKIFLAHYQLD
jgi:YgiT-type zinc finger domain-containing protein